MKSTDYQPVVIPRSYSKSMTYQERDYHIFVSVPADPPPESGFPVIYLLDGNSVFATMTEAIRIQSRGPERTGVYPAIVVGIGYPTDGPYHPARFFDYTYEVPASELPGTPKGADWPQMGEQSSSSPFWRRSSSLASKTTSPSIGRSKRFLDIP